MSPDRETGLLADVRREYEEREHLGDVWNWAEGGRNESQDGLAIRARRFNAAAHFAGNRKAQAQGADERGRWAHAQVSYRAERDRLEERIERRQHKGLPDRVSFYELLHHAPGPHIHAAAPYDQLIAIGKVAEQEGLRVGEFPPFDVVDCVHITGSFHYRDKASPSTARPCSDVGAGRSSGLAADINHLTDAAAEYRFYLDLQAIAA